jgi:septal ring factor EnvC (AmiA/AmiB activator)
MRGFGNLLILDHGSNYLSVYANNETLYKQVGSRVRQGETIASVGSSGGEDQPGLYFELRYKGKPFNPEGWLSR